MLKTYPRPITYEHPPPNKPKRATRTTRQSAKTKGSGAVAQGRQAKAAGKRGVIVEGDNSGILNTGEFYQTIIQQAARPGASAADLRRAYLAWLSDMGKAELSLLRTS